jgi:hypothetical protein
MDKIAVLLATHPPSDDLVRSALLDATKLLTYVQIPPDMEEEFVIVHECIFGSEQITPNTHMDTGKQEHTYNWLELVNKRNLKAQFGLNGLNPLFDYLRQLLGALSCQVDSETSLVFVRLVNTTWSWVHHVHQLVTAFIDAQPRSLSAMPKDEGKGKGKRYSSSSSYYAYSNFIHSAPQCQSLIRSPTSRRAPRRQSLMSRLTSRTSPQVCEPPPSHCT